MSIPQSYEWKEIGTYSLSGGGFTEIWDASNFTITGLQVRVENADAADAVLQPQTSINGIHYPTYEAPFSPPVGSSDHAWMVGVFSSRFLRVNISPGSNTTGTVQLWAYGKV